MLTSTCNQISTAFERYATEAKFSKNVSRTRVPDMESEEFLPLLEQHMK